VGIMQINVDECYRVYCNYISDENLLECFKKAVKRPVIINYYSESQVLKVVRGDFILIHEFVYNDLLGGKILRGK
jgi:hypothetical protein